MVIKSKWARALLVGILFVAGQSQASAYQGWNTVWTKVNNFLTHPAGIYVQFDSLEKFECASTFAFIDITDPHFKENYAAILAAKLADRGIKYYVIGCTANNAYPIVLRLRVK